MLSKNRVFNFCRNYAITKRGDGKILKERVGVVYYLTKFHFWAMIIVWEFELMKVISALSNIDRNYVTIYLAFGLFRFNLLILTLTLMCFAFSITHIIYYRSGKFPLISLLTSTLFLIFIMFGYFSGLNNSENLVYQSILDVQNFFQERKLPFFTVERLQVDLLIAIFVLLVLLSLLFYIYYYKYLRKNNTDNANLSELNNNK